MARSQRPPLGTRGWEVEWCKSCPYVDGNPDYGIDTDKAEMVCRYFHGEGAKQKALDYAREVYPKDFFGSVSITEVELIDPYDDGIPRTYYWEAIADSEHYEGED